MYDSLMMGSRGAPQLILPLVMITLIVAAIGMAPAVDVTRRDRLGRCLGAVAAGQPASAECLEDWSRQGEPIPFPSAIEVSGSRRLLQDFPPSAWAGEESFFIGEDRVVIVEQPGRVLVSSGRRWDLGGAAGNLMKAALVLFSLALACLFGSFLLTMTLQLPKGLWELATGKDPFLGPGRRVWDVCAGVVMAVFMAGLPLVMCLVLLPGVVTLGGRLLLTSELELRDSQAIVRRSFAGVPLSEFRLAAASTSLVAVGLGDRAAVLAVWRSGSWPLFYLPAEEASRAAWLDRRLQGLPR